MQSPMGALRLVKAVILNRWMVVVASFIVMISAGGVYSFGIYSQSLKLYLGYDQQTLNTISFFKDLGTNVGVIGGILYDWTGPKPVFATGAFMNVAGYVMIWLGVTGRIAKPEVWHMCFYFILASSWAAFVNTACIVTIIKNFPLSRGIVMGLLKGSLGLGGAILTLLYRAIYGDKPQSFILLLAWFPTVVCLLLMFIIRIVNLKQLKSDMKYFYVFLGMILTMAAYLMIVIITEDISKVSRSTNQVFCAIMFLLLLFPVWVVVRDEINNRKLETASLKPQDFHSVRQIIPQIATSNVCGRDAKDLEASNNLDSVSTIVGRRESTIAESLRLGSSSNYPKNTVPLQEDKAMHFGNVSYQQTASEKIQAAIFGKVSDQQTVSENTQSPSKPSDIPVVGETYRNFTKFVEEAQKATDLTPAQAFFNLNLWIMFIASICGLGSQLMVIDNLGQIGASLGYSPTNITTCVSLVSIWNCLGRVGSGFISESFLERRAVPRPLFLVVVLLVSCLGHLILAFNLPAALYLGSIIIGLCYGAQFTLIFTIVSEICGLQFFATIFNILQLSSPLGLYLLSVRTAGILYDKEAEKQQSVLRLSSFVKQLVAAPTPSGSAPHATASTLLCYGSQCFKTTFFIMTGASFLGAIVACMLTVRTRWLYKHLHALHHRQDEVVKTTDSVQTTSEDQN